MTLLVLKSSTPKFWASVPTIWQPIASSQKKYKLKFPLLADERGEIQKQYAPGRVTFIIDKNGVVRFVQQGVPKNKDLLKELEKL